MVATPSFVETVATEYLSPTAWPGSTTVRPTQDFMPQQSVGDEVTRNLFLPARALSDAADIVAVEKVNNVWALSRWDHDSQTVEDVLFTRGLPGQMWALVVDGTNYDFYSRDFTLNRPANSGDSLSVALGSEAGVSGG